MPKTTESLWDRASHFFSLRSRGFQTAFAETKQNDPTTSKPQRSALGVFTAPIRGVITVLPWTGISCYGYVAGQIATLEGSATYLPRVSRSVFIKNLPNHVLFRGARQMCREPVKTATEQFMKENDYGASITGVAEAGATSLADAGVYQVEVARIIRQDTKAPSYRHIYSNLFRELGSFGALARLYRGAPEFVLRNFLTLMPTFASWNVTSNFLKSRGVDFNTSEIAGATVGTIVGTILSTPLEVARNLKSGRADTKYSVKLIQEAISKSSKVILPRGFQLVATTGALLLSTLYRKRTENLAAKADVPDQPVSKHVGPRSR